MTSHYLILGDPVPVEEHELQADVFQAVVSEMWELKDEGLVEDGVQGPLLHVGLLLGDALVVVQQVDLDIRICNYFN